MAFILRKVKTTQVHLEVYELPDHKMDIKHKAYWLRDAKPFTNRLVSTDSALIEEFREATDVETLILNGGNAS